MTIAGNVTGVQVVVWVIELGESVSMIDKVQKGPSLPSIPLSKASTANTSKPLMVITGVRRWNTILTPRIAAPANPCTANKTPRRRVNGVEERPPK